MPGSSPFDANFMEQYRIGHIHYVHDADSTTVMQKFSEGVSNPSFLQ